jgi:soluble lytic murein transglycosylase-like protein
MPSHIEPTAASAGTGLSRRQVITTLVIAAAAPLLSPAAALATKGPSRGLHDTGGRVNIVVPDNYNPFARTSRTTYRAKLTKATLRFVEQGYGGRNMPIWGKRPDQVDLEKRVSNLAYWVLAGVEQHAGIWPMDPAWVMAQMMAESFFYEFAISWAFAVGPCQFIPDTARGYGMLVAGDKPEHFASPYAKAELAPRYKDYLQARSKLSDLRRSYAAEGILPPEKAGEKSWRETLREILDGGTSKAERYLEYLELAERHNQELDAARNDFTDYMRANFEGRDIFRKEDNNFLKTFDGRVFYREPCSSMVRMLAEGLRARSGNIIAAAASYHAGLSSTRDIGCYEPYGRLPPIESTVTYVSRILVNHHEIVERMG